MKTESRIGKMKGAANWKLRRIGKRLLSYLKDKEIPEKEEDWRALAWLLASYPPHIRSAIALKLSEEWTRKLSPNDALSLLQRLEGEEKAGTERICVEIAETRKGGKTTRCWVYKLHVAFYSSVAGRRLVQDPSWKLVNLPVLRGWVWLEPNRLVRFVKEYLYFKLYDLANEAEKEAGRISREDVPEALKSVLELIDSEYAPRRSAVQEGVHDYAEREVDAPLVEEAFPPCIKKLIERAEKGENLGHQERLALALFLIQFVKNNNATVDDIVKYFRNLPDFSEKKTKYYLEHAVKKGYLSMSCQRIDAELGGCPGCEWRGKVRTPWGAYLKNLKKLSARGRVVSRSNEENGNASRGQAERHG